MPLNLADYAHEYIDFAPAMPATKAESIAVFTRKYGGSFEAIGTNEKFLMLLSILDYLGSASPDYPMSHAVSFQDGDGHLSAGIDGSSPDPTIAEWLSHFATLDQLEESNGLLWGIAATLFEQLRSGCE